MESVQHVKLIRAFVNEEKDYKKLQTAAKDCYDTEKNLSLCNQHLVRLLDFLLT